MSQTLNHSDQQMDHADQQMDSYREQKRFRVTPHSRANQITRVLWACVYWTLFRPSPRPLYGWRRMLIRAFGGQVGKRVRTFPSVKIWAPWNLVLHDDCALGDGVDCYAVGTIEIGRSTTVSQNTVLCGATHDYSKLNLPLVIGEIHIGAFAWITAQCFIMPDVTIGDGTVVGVRSLVLNDLPAWKVAVGHPCKVIADRTVDAKPNE